MNVPIPDLDDAVLARLRADGQRYTSARRALVRVLEGAERPLAMHELLGENAELAQSSTYRNLALLERVGVVHRIATGDDFGRYELAEDLTDHHHHHLICRRCGSVDDFEVSPQLERTLARAFAAVTTATGFQADHHRLDLVGTCHRCD